MYLVIWKAILLIGWLNLLFVFCKKGKLIAGIIAVMWLGIIAMAFELVPIRIGYALPSAGADRQVASFLVDTWRQRKPMERPSFWDKGAYIALANGYAAGNRFGEDGVYKGKPTLISPIYPFIVSLIHRVTGIGLIKIYDIGAIIVLIAVGMVFYYFGSPRDLHVKLKHCEYRYEGMIMAFCLLYLSPDGMPLNVDKILTRATFWNTFVLLRPGHMLIYVLIPLLFYCLAKRVEWKKTVLGGIIMGLLISIYFASFIFVSVGIFIYLCFVFASERKTIKQEIKGCLWISLIALILSSWYWWPIVSYGVMSNEAVPFRQIFFAWYHPRRVYDFLESTFFMGPLFWLGLIGIFVMLKRKRKGDYLILGFIGSTYLFKLIIYPLLWYFFKFSFHAGECFEYFLRPAMALSAGIGVNAIINVIIKNKEDIKNFIKARLKNNIWTKELIRKISSWTGFSLEKKACVTAGLLLILTPYAAPIWHVPSFNWWSHFDRKLRSYENEHLLSWIENETEHDAVFLADHGTSLHIATYTGRKLMKAAQNGPTLVNYNLRKEAARIVYEYDTSTEDLKDFINKYQISYVVWNELIKKEYPDANLNNLENKNVFKKVYTSGSLSVYKVI
ncbi:MAG: hypothetical protein JRJ42_08255 [Deltaproteobacteria bacterium]|nr:hypothetical protein [Deltaproteobacteria bacterium]